ncbi:MAG: hypothetical protein GY839_00395 [candidate division Zixibacteria bacterium]|nr:hypothetical protein [candidate division Zixibacteria bacterium]
MKNGLCFFSAIIVTCIFSCTETDNDTPKTKPDIDRFAHGFKDIHDIANLRRLTDTEQDAMPFFSPSDEKVYFERLVPLSPDVIGGDYDRGFFAVNRETGQLFMLAEQPELIQISTLNPDSLPIVGDEVTLYGFRTDDAFYFATRDVSGEPGQTIYKQTVDSLVQLTYGSGKALLKEVSSDGRYLTFLYGNETYQLVVIDNNTGLYYAVPRPESDSDRSDISARFSQDGRYLAFIKSSGFYDDRIVPWGDIWLIEFKPDMDK